MGFNRVRFGGNEIFEVIVRDNDGRKIEEWKCMREDFPRVVKILVRKFGLSLENKEPQNKKDLDWAV